MGQLFTEKYGNVTVRALSWKQPYASLMLQGKIETRTWHSTYKGWVLICASQTGYTPSMVLKISGENQQRRISEQLCGPENYKLLPSGLAIAIGKLYLSNPIRDYVNPSAPSSGLDVISDQCFVSYSPGLWCHHYTNVQAIEPFGWKGTQGWSTVSNEVKSKIVLI